MRIRHIVLCVTFAIGMPPAEGAAGQRIDRAQRDYEAAMAASDDGRRIELLARSYEEYETYEAAVALGETLLGVGEWRRAREWFDQAYGLGGTDEERARALFRIGESHASEDRWVEAVDYLQQADELYDLPMIGRALRAARREMPSQIVPSARIAETLTAPTRGARARRRMNLHINFEFDSARMTRDGRAQAAQLGEAMRMISDAVWLLVGHTDAQGTRSYNQALSLRRAASVRAYLVDEFGLDPRDIDVEGRGEDELLDSDTTDAAHSVNRRVEVVRR